MQHASRIILLIASAAAYALAFPPFGWWPLALLSVGMLTGLLYDAASSRKLMTGFCWGMLAFGTGLSWLWNIFGAFSILLWGILAVFPAVFGWLVALAQRRGMNGWRLALFTALAWAGTEFVRCELMPLRFPWMNLGLAVEPWPLVSWIGVYGLGFVAMLVVASLVSGKAWLAAVIVLVGVFAWFMEPEMFATSGKPVAAIQAETAPLSTYLELSKQVPADTRLVVWPECAVPKDVRHSEAGELSAIHDLAIKSNVLIVFGTQTRLEGAKWQNTALTVDGSRVIGEHGKNHTVHLFDDGEHGLTAASFETTIGENRISPPFVGKIGTPICFDCDFQDVVRRMTLDGAEFFAVPSMDAANWSAKQHIQHAQLFRVRAAENRRCMVVAASSGVSQIIDQNGRATATLGAMKQGVLSGTIVAINELTFFTRWGWLTPWVAMSALLFWTIKLLAFSKEKMQQPVVVRPT